jgi:hypothetical protein
MKVDSFRRLLREVLKSLRAFINKKKEVLKWINEGSDKISKPGSVNFASVAQ